MKILQLVQTPQRRGAEVFSFQLSQVLRRQGHEVRIAYLYPYSGDNALPLQAGDCLLAGQKNHPFEKFPGVHPGLLGRLRRLLAEFRPEVVQVNGARTIKYGAFARYFGRNDSWVLIYRNIGQPQDWIRGRHYYFFYRQFVMPHLDGVVSVSRATLQSLSDFYTLTIPMTHIPNGVDLTTLNPTKSRQAVRYETRTPPESPVLLFVGSLTPEKRLDRLLRVAHQVRLRLPELHLWLIGDGSLRSALTRQVKREGMANMVHFLGTQADVASYMNAADLFLLTSDTEGIPAVILEAGLLGLPVVVTQVGGLPECVLDGETGILVEPQHEAGLAQATLQLLQDPTRRTEMGARAKKWTRTHFRMEIVAQKYSDFYQQVLAHVRKATV